MPYIRAVVCLHDREFLLPVWYSGTPYCPASVMGHPDHAEPEYGGDFEWSPVNETFGMALSEEERESLGRQIEYQVATDDGIDDYYDYFEYFD